MVVVIAVNELETVVNSEADAPAAAPRTDSPVANEDEIVTNDADVSVEFMLTDEREEDMAVDAIEVEDDTAKLVAVKDEDRDVLAVESDADNDVTAADVEEDIAEFVTVNEDDREANEMFTDDEIELTLNVIEAKD